MYVNSNRSFEETCLRFMKLGGKEGDASLIQYLTFCLNKYNRRVAAFEDDDLKPNPKYTEQTQRTVLATWLLELKLCSLEDAQSYAMLRKERAE